MRPFVTLRSLLLVSLLAVPVTAWAQPFAAPWIGYDVGISAFPGNPAPYERDPYAIASADFDGDGDADVVVANYDYASPGGTSGQSGFALLFNAGDGTFGAPTHYTFTTKGSFDVVVEDFDEDGDPDLALPNSGRITSEAGNTVVLFRNDGTGAFTQVGEYPVGERPLSLAAGDFNADGHRDLVVDSYRFDSEHVAVLLGTGTGSFGPRTLVPVGDVPSDVAAGDFNGDGYDDIAVSALGDLTVVMNDGAGGFMAAQNLSGTAATEPVVSTLAVVHLNDDGHLDLVHAAYQSSGTGGQHVWDELVVRFGQGDGTFAAPIYYDLGDYVHTPDALVPADLDGDGDLDLVSVHESGQTSDGIVVLVNDGTGALTVQPPFPAGQTTADAAVADVDGDGDLDLLTSDRSSMAVTVHRNPGDGGFPKLGWTPTNTANNIRLVTGDVDGDGDLDVFSSSEGFGTPGALLKNNGDGTFAEPVVYTHSTEYGRGVSTAKLRDLDGDGDLDLLYNDAHTDFFTGYDFWTALNDGTGTFGTPVEWDLNTCGNGDVDAFDLDNDGDLDVVNTEELNCAGTGNGNRLFIRLGNGDATYQAPFATQVAQFPHALAGGDFDEDGIIDLVTVHWGAYGSSTVAQLHLGNGDGTLQAPRTYAVGQGPRYLVVADLDGDGHLDVATANSGADGIGRETMTVLWGTGSGTLTGRTDYYAPYSDDLLGATGIEAGDVDGDGDLDLMMTTSANGVAIYYNDGTRGFVSPHRLGITWGPWSPVFADFTGDDRPDLLTVVGLPPSGNPSGLALLPGLTDALPTTEEPSSPASDLPDGYVLSAVYPNPFNPQARFTLAVAERQAVTVAVFDALGRRVAVLHDGPLAAGPAHGFTLDGSDLPSGVYVVRATGETFTAAHRATLLK